METTIPNSVGHNREFVGFVRLLPSHSYTRGDCRVRGFDLHPEGNMAANLLLLLRDLSIRVDMF